MSTPRIEVTCRIQRSRATSRAIAFCEYLHLDSVEASALAAMPENDARAVCDACWFPMTSNVHDCC